MGVNGTNVIPKSYREKIRCPECGLVQTAMVLLTKPFHTKQRTCIECGCKIDANTSEGDWDVVYTTATEEVICPYCGEEVGYNVEMADRDGEIIDSCDCGKNFKLSIQTIVEFTSLADCELDEQEHQWVVNPNFDTPVATSYYCVKCDATKTEGGDKDE